MKRTSLILLLSIFHYTIVYSCINVNAKTLMEGTIISLDKGDGVIPYGHKFLDINFEAKLAELNSYWMRFHDLNYRSDYAVILILQKRYEEAKTIFLEIEAAKPNLYSTAANLGTVYELLGQNENALTWIKKAIKIDPESHFKSEWLHVKILEAKMKGASYINSKFLIGTDFGKDSDPETDLTGFELIQLRNALYYQLNERVSFVKPKDEIVALLLFDLGNIAMLTKAKKEAVVIYRMAFRYGYSDPVINERFDEATSKRPSVSPGLLFFGIGALSIIGSLFVVWRIKHAE